MIFLDNCKNKSISFYFSCYKLFMNGYGLRDVYRKEIRSFTGTVFSKDRIKCPLNLLRISPIQESGLSDLSFGTQVCVDYSFG